MAALSELQLLSRATANLLPVIQQGEQAYVEMLNETGRTMAVDGVRAMQLQRVILVVGMFSIFEAAAKDEFDWDGSIPEKVRTALTKIKKDNLAVRFQQFWDANNILKHGSGKSHDRLLAAQDILPFRVRKTEERFFEEGDIAEVHPLVLVDDDFVNNCAALIEDTASGLAEAACA